MPTRVRPASPSSGMSLLANTMYRTPPTPNMATVAPDAVSDKPNVWCRCEAQMANTPNPAAPSMTATVSTMRDQGAVTIMRTCSK